MRKFRKNLIGVLVLSVLIFTSCKKESQDKLEISASKVDVENFETFYDRFHNDSLFQISRVRFPLNGYSFDSGVKKDWNKENWLMMKVKIQDVDTTKYKVKYVKTDSTFSQKFWLENSDFWGEYKFEILGKKWYLTYATEHN